MKGTLYIDSNKIDKCEAVLSHLAVNGIQVKPYDMIFTDLENMDQQKIIMDIEIENSKLYSSAAMSHSEVIHQKSPILNAKQTKNAI